MKKWANEDDLYNILMTSDFDDSWSLEEIKEIFNKYKYYNKYQIAKSEQLSKNIDQLELTLKEKEELYNMNINRLLYDNSVLLDKIANFKNRKITLKERIKGKLNIGSDEIK